MAKLITEENLKSKHPESFKALKSHGYVLTDTAGYESYSLHRGHRVNIYDDGTWKYKHVDGIHNRASGKSHSDLKVHLNKAHKSL